ncbi:MAG: DNA mismatch repair protein MutS [Candidatus Wallbacteria bacterium GWC2_49_35]|uniref:DNA mismatch repair protein MutS n=1 Tax=Candidatus Wallbacteria bacterium GWC2_49_35 TaxID=1817813 RepID=A0A1F7WKG9_9BACT|nr:MAG: DNA mismatch repair protein MutS [Candidatus Wallbacteria bacterium GWC2_49_35]HBC76178.1 DNA mismatch repair protein MutS [Candidatus Wallbacteria bacterium]
MAKTPMMEQYEQIKSRYPGMILFFRVGDFYETFFEDARTAAAELNIVLTARGREEGDPIPLAGVPYHSIENYISRLVRRGYKIAICDQVEDPKEAKGIVKRDVTRVITPGTLTEANYLDETSNNYLAAIYYEKGIFGFAYADISTTDFHVSEFSGDSALRQLLDEIGRVSPPEALVAKELLATPGFELDLKRGNTKALTISAFEDDYPLDYQAAVDFLCSHFGVATLEGFGLNESNSRAATVAACAVVKYLYQTQKNSVAHIRKINLRMERKFMHLDVQSRLSLDIIPSLFGVLNFTKTTMGARLLKSWLESPLCDIAAIEWRQRLAGEFYGDIHLRRRAAECLSGIYDIERIMSRVSLRNCNARDITALKKSFAGIRALAEVIRGAGAAGLGEFFSCVPDFTALSDLIDRAVVDDPPLSLRDGGIIRGGYDAGLDEVNKIAHSSKEWLLNLEQNEQRRSGIKSLKIKYNRVFGYYIEITKANLSSIPDNYIRKQTLANAERFYTPELKEMESMILNADERQKKLEYELFMKLLDEIARHTDEIYAAACAAAVADTLMSFAEAAARYNYAKPEITGGDEIEIIEGRHPVVENRMNYMGFINNDAMLGGAHAHVQILTGPNMAGKSTYIRQVALIVLMAQAGSFVPAKRARLGLCDRIFTRIGASDNLAAGQSTFMVEMIETANILNNATPKSLIILDEVGRGTSTYDGLAIAYSVIEFILSGGGNLLDGARTLFATHYHELTVLDKTFAKVENLNVAVADGDSGVVFLHKILPGPAGRSYGIHVAKIAGLPEQVVDRAAEILRSFEESDEKNNIARLLKKASGARHRIDENQLDLFEAPSAKAPAVPPEVTAIIEKIQKIDINALTPLESLNILSQIAGLASNILIAGK